MTNKTKIRIVKTGEQNHLSLLSAYHRRSLFTEKLSHSQLIQEYIALQAFSCVPFFPESSLSDIVLNMQDILLEEIANRFISVSGPIALNESYQAHFFQF